MTRKAVPLSAAKRKALVGTYEIRSLGTFEIAEQDDKRVLGIREGVVEPLHAGSFDVPFKRIKTTQKN